MKDKLLLILVLVIVMASTVMAVEAPIYYGDNKVPVKQNIQVLDSNDTGGDIWLQFGNALSEILYWDADGGDGTGIFDFTDSLLVEGFLSLTPISLPGSPTTGDLVIDSGDSNTLKWYDGSAWKSGGSGLKKLMLEPGAAVHQADGSANNCDSWRYYDYTDLENYNKIQGNTDNQDIDVVYKAWLPNDFSTWNTGAMGIVFKTSSATPTTSGVYCVVYDTDNALAYTTNTGASTIEAALAITGAQLTDGAEVWDAGNHFLIRCTGAVDSAAWANIGRVEYYYNS